MIRKVRPLLFAATVGAASLVLGWCVGLFLGRDVQVEVSPGVAEDDLRKIRKVGVIYGQIPRVAGTWWGTHESFPPGVFLRHLIADLEKGPRFEVVKEEVIWRVLAETKSDGWDERFMAAAKRAGADGLIAASVTFFSPSAIGMRRGGGVASATAQVVGLSGPTVVAKVTVAYQSPGAAIADAASALAEAIQEKILRP